MKHKDYVILTIIILLGVFIRVIYWLHIHNNFYQWDENYHGLSGLVIYKFILSGFSLDYLNELIRHYWSILYSLFFYPYGYGLLTAISLFFFGNNLFAIRLPSMVFSILLILATYLLSRELFNKKISLIAAFFTAINPFIIIFGGLALVDVPMAYFMIMSLYFILKSFKEDENKYYFLSGLFIGLAGFMKPPGFIVLIPILIIIFLYKKFNWQYLKKTYVLVLAMFIFFLIYFGSGLFIYIFVNNIEVKNTIFYYIFHWFLGSKTIPASNNLSFLTLDGWWFYLKIIPQQIGGYVITLITFLGIFILLKNKEKKVKLFLLTYLIFIFVTFVIILQKDSRFTIPYLPILSILAALTVERIWVLCKTKGKIIFFTLIIGLIIIIEFVFINNKIISIMAYKINYYNLIPTVQNIFNNNIDNQSIIIATDRESGDYGIAIPDISLLVLLNDNNLNHYVYYKNQSDNINYFITANKIETTNWPLINQTNNGIIIYTYQVKENPLQKIEAGEVNQK